MQIGNKYCTVNWNIRSWDFDTGTSKTPVGIIDSHFFYQPTISSSIARDTSDKLTLHSPEQCYTPSPSREIGLQTACFVFVKFPTKSCLSLPHTFFSTSSFSLIKQQVDNWNNFGHTLPLSCMTRYRVASLSLALSNHCRFPVTTDYIEQMHLICKYFSRCWRVR